MKKLSRLSKVTLLLAVLFGIDKILGVARQMLISRQFGLSAELDVFNAANNLPDMLFMLISGGALAIAFIPVLTEVLTKKGQEQAWNLFSNILNIAFITTAVLAVIVAIFARPLITNNSVSLGLHCRADGRNCKAAAFEPHFHLDLLVERFGHGWFAGQSTLFIASISANSL